MVNFFFLDRNLPAAARAHGDKHLNKMVTEAAQIVSSTMRLLCESLPDFVTNIEPNIYRLAHRNHPVTKWACRSRAHWLMLCEYGLALVTEKERRIDNMTSLPKSQQKNWKRDHASAPILRFCRDNPPSLDLFPETDTFSDPPKCMPVYLHCDENGIQLDVVQSYRLYYTGNKRVITKLKWLPYVEEPVWLEECQNIINSRPDIIEGLNADLEKQNNAKEKKKPKKATTVKKDTDNNKKRDRSLSTKVENNEHLKSNKKNKV